MTAADRSFKKKRKRYSPLPSIILVRNNLVFLNVYCSLFNMKWWRTTCNLNIIWYKANLCDSTILYGKFLGWAVSLLLRIFIGIIKSWEIFTNCYLFSYCVDQFCNVSFVTTRFFKTMAIWIYFVCLFFFWSCLYNLYQQFVLVAVLSGKHI